MLRGDWFLCHHHPQQPSYLSEMSVLTACSTLLRTVSQSTLEQLSITSGVNVQVK